MAKEEPAGQLREISLTARGAATRDRIVHGAADLMYVKGVNATTLDDIREATGTSKSQLYRHFPDKESLVRAVIALRGQQVLERETGRLGRLSSYSGLVRWRNALIAANARQNGAYGCALGSMASEVADQDERARVLLADLFRTWEELIAAGLRRMRDKGTLKPGADPGALAVGLMAAVQGGYLLANTAHDVRPMEIAIDLALEHLKSFLAAPLSLIPVILVRGENMPAETRSYVELLRVALEQAREAQRAGDHPYGSVIITDEGTVAERNRVESTPDPTAHSEVMAVRTAASRWGLAALADSTLVTSSEPCPMCCAAILEAGVGRLVIGNRRTVGEPPLGDYSVEALLAMLGRTADLAVETLTLPEITRFYA